MTPPADAIDELIAHLHASLTQGRFVKMVLAKYRGPEPDLTRVDVRLVHLRDAPHLQFVFHHTTRDITRNHPIDAGIEVVRSLLGTTGFRSAHLSASDALSELSLTQRGQAHLRHLPQAGNLPAPPALPHNRDKPRLVSIDRPFLVELGVTTPDHRLIPAMARKWKQINKFVEVLAGALAASTLAQARALRVVDFGSGKGTLTFAVHDWLHHTRQLQAEVTGVELRPDLVHFCNQVVERLALTGLHFEAGDVRSRAPGEADLVIALHACDIATDHAIHLGLQGGAQVIVCSPCCHKQIRPQLLSPHPLRPILQHGVHLGQEAEMLTDGLRALLLEAAGYDTQVFEFVSLEHTSKNKMILAVKRVTPRPAAPVLAQIAEIKAFYGIREQCLEGLMRADGMLA